MSVTEHFQEFYAKAASWPFRVVRWVSALILTLATTALFILALWFVVGLLCCS